VCLTAEASPAERDAVRAAGAVAFVDKGDPLADLVAALREAAREKGLT
jgi:CheY-like chemotaxis protein